MAQPLPRKVSASMVATQGPPCGPAVNRAKYRPRSVGTGSFVSSPGATRARGGNRCRLRRQELAHHVTTLPSSPASEPTPATSDP